MSSLKVVSSAITLLPFLSPKKKNDKPNEPEGQQQPLIPTRSLQFAAKLTQLRVKRIQTFFRKRTEHREVVARARANPVALITHKLSRIVSLFSKSNRPALKAKIRAFFSREGLKSGVKGFLGAIRSAFKRLRGPSAAELLQRELLRLQQKARRQAFLIHLFHALAVQGRNLLRGKRKRLWREKIALFAPGFVNKELLGDHEVLRIAKLIFAKREAEKLCKNAEIIQRAWRGAQRKQLAHRESKQRLLGLLTIMSKVLKQQDKVNKACEDVLKHTCEQTNAIVLLGTTRRLAVRLIQRVWRGYRARLRVFQICAWRRKKELQKLQRERLKKAKEALLSPSVRELQQVRLMNTRIQSQKEKTPLILPPGFHPRHSNHLFTHERASLLEPLPMQHTPPRVSATTRTKTQRVPFSKFERICAQRAKVNPQNLWVAIPVGFSAATSELLNAEQLQLKSRIKMTKKKNRFFAAQYDWVPATLLQHEIDSQQ